MSWFEEYRCGCISPVVRSEKKLLGYCPVHGASRKNLYQNYVLKERLVVEEPKQRLDN